MSDLNPNQPGSNAEQEQLHKEGSDYIKEQVQKKQIADDGTGKAIPTTSKMENTDHSKGRAEDTFDSGVSQRATDGQTGPGNTFDSGVSNTATDGQSGPGNTFDSGVTRTATDNQSGPGDTMDTGVNKNVGSEGHLEREESGQKAPKKEGAKKMENESAIPTAGGQRLGVEHWGESKIVPENPKPQESEGVSSRNGQPDAETAKNTAKNAGGHGSAGEGEGKQSVIDKIMDKLPIGGKNKE
ncbi:hypothetical protein AC578_2226 [Pseudocercospora eumusae]|uniref:Uncharacterized protein n=1 Tax=Pseudocercospora eumusae TaxID=321146 RepID=A0A139HAW9_9PEZI|nr:hypothetical protein AC578_2226 [Pseudocercospora eumusae]